VTVGEIVHARAPLRLGLAGGGTDVAPYCDMFGGRVLNTTISLFTHCHIHEIAGDFVEFFATDFDARLQILAENVSTASGVLQLHRAVYRHMCERYLSGRRPSLRVVTYSDAPPGSGVGSSSALVVAMVQAYAELYKLPVSEYDVARIAYEIERVECAMAGGKQDQYAAAFGGFNFMEFGDRDRVVINPLRIRRTTANELESRILLYYTGQSRESARIIEAQIDAAKRSDPDALEAMHTIREAANQMKEALLTGRVRDALDILGLSWNAKKRAAHGITNLSIDEVARVATSAGATGLKVSGAGGGGFMMIASEPSDQQRIRRALIPFGGQFFSFTFVDQGVESWKCK
jgi:D-glycero-alpha-D-manno-heptose-7-phosphate kinase